MLGYRTGIFGKWHLGDNYPHRPMDRGFDEAVYHQGWGMTAAPEFVGKLNDGRYFHNGEEKQFKGYMTDFWFDKAIAWMKECKAKNEPFLCYLPTNAPHAPHVVADKYTKPYLNLKKCPAGFFGMIANIDENIGRLEAFLQESGLAENTIVIFMTDNGGTGGVQVFNAGLRGNKTTFYEGGHRVPCWVSWPAGKLGMPRDVEIPAQMQDLFPTLMDLAGGKRPVDYHLDGASLACAMRNADGKLADRMMVVQYSTPSLTKYRISASFGINGDSFTARNSTTSRPTALDERHGREASGRRQEDEGSLRQMVDRPRTALRQIRADDDRLREAASLTSSDWQDLYRQRRPRL